MAKQEWLFRHWTGRVLVGAGSELCRLLKKEEAATWDSKPIARAFAEQHRIPTGMLRLADTSEERRR